MYSEMWAIFWYFGSYFTLWCCSIIWLWVLAVWGLRAWLWCCGGFECPGVWGEGYGIWHCGGGGIWHCGGTVIAYVMKGYSAFIFRTNSPVLWLLDPWDEVTTILWNVGTYSPDDTLYLLPWWHAVISRKTSDLNFSKPSCVVSAVQNAGAFFSKLLGWFVGSPDVYCCSMYSMCHKVLYWDSEVLQCDCFH
jgi:hypothetical protein